MVNVRRFMTDYVLLLMMVMQVLTKELLLLLFAIFADHRAR